MTPRATAFVGIAAGVLLLAYLSAGVWLDRSLSQALDGLGSQR